MQGCFSEMLESWTPMCSFFKRELEVAVPQLREIILLKRRIACQRLPI